MGLVYFLALDSLVVAEGGRGGRGAATAQPYYSKYPHAVLDVLSVAEDRDHSLV